MSLVTILPSGKTIDVVAGTTLLAAILAAEMCIRDRPMPVLAPAGR